MYNQEFKNINTEDKAYLLGLLYSDGNISTGNDNRYLIRIQLKLTDEEILLKTVEKFPFFKKYYTKDSLTIYFSSKNAWKDLINIGLLPRKSFDNSKNIKFPKITTNYYFDFIRGYIDGNGTISLTYRKNKANKKVNLYSVSLTLLRQIRYILYKNNIFSSIYIDQRKGIFSDKTFLLYHLRVKTSSLKELYLKLYDKKSLFLKRKQVKFEEINNTLFFVKAVCPNCKFCSSPNTVKNGTDKFYSAQRYLCKDCKKNFIILNTAPDNSNVICEQS